MATLKELRDVRISKLNELVALGVNPFPAKSHKNTDNASVRQNYAAFEGKDFTVAGRVTSLRSHGQLYFIDIKDSTGTIQLYLHSDSLKTPDRQNSELAFADLHLLDLGDFVEAFGKVTKTQRGEISIAPKIIRLLTKSLRPLPMAWDGLKDKEQRFRRRYIDTNINTDVYNRFIRRAKFWEAHREFFKTRGFLEMNIPVLEPIPGGADATPFVTHMDAIDQNFFLRISHELYLKRLIGGGYEKVYEIGPRFRNEGLSDEHLPEHIAMEFYWAYASWEDGMKLIQDLFNYILDYVYDGRRTFHIRGFDVEFKENWDVIDFATVMQNRFGIDIYTAELSQVQEVGRKNGLNDESLQNVHRGIDSLWKLLRREIAGPAFLINHPKYLSPLSKSKAENPHITERFQPIIAGSELGNGWSELNDPLDQYARFAEQQDLRDAGDAEAQWLDIDYVEMLEYGMPPTFGYGHSERVFWFLEDVSAREGVIFPQLKFAIDEVTKDIYQLPSNFGTHLKTNDQKNTSKSTSGHLPKRNEAEELLQTHVKDNYQKLHAHMVAHALERYARKYNEDPELWYITGLLHDLDYYEYPEEHPLKSLVWFKEKGYPSELIHAVAAHYWAKTEELPKTKLAAALIAVDELAGLLYAYSLMRENGFTDMQVASAKKKFKDKSFAAKVNRDEISFGVEHLGVTLDEHMLFLIEAYQSFSFKA